MKTIEAYQKMIDTFEDEDLSQNSFRGIRMALDDLENKYYSSEKYQAQMQPILPIGSLAGADTAYRLQEDQRIKNAIQEGCKAALDEKFSTSNEDKAEQ